MAAADRSPPGPPPPPSGHGRPGTPGPPPAPRAGPVPPSRAPRGPGQPPPDDTPTRALPEGRHTRPRATRAQLLERLRRQLPFLVVMLVVAVAFWRIALHHWREGATEIGVALLLAAVLRARTSRETAGLLAVRGKRVDVVTYALGGVVLVLVALTITGGPLATR